ncbi:hypothetical protein [Streptomyces venezuelae]|nr:hypothetical protein [Streptomyces venezuelae]
MKAPSTPVPHGTSTEGMSKKTRMRKWRAKKRKANHGKRPA